MTFLARSTYYFCCQPHISPLQFKTFSFMYPKSNEVKSSYHMELEGLKRALGYLQESGVKVCEVVTDRHSQVKKYTRTQHGSVIHSFDCWHVGKGKYISCFIYALFVYFACCYCCNVPSMSLRING